jgi:hypothetical protein
VASLSRSDPVAGRVDEPRLCLTDLERDQPDGESLARPQLVERAGDQPPARLAVIDREAGAAPDPSRVDSQQAVAEGVEGPDRHPPGGLSDQPLEPLAELVGGLVGERDHEQPDEDKDPRRPFKPRGGAVDALQVKRASRRTPRLERGDRLAGQRTLQSIGASAFCV